MNVPHALFNHSDHHMYSIPTIPPLRPPPPACGVRPGEADVVAVAMQEEVITETLAHGFGRENIPSAMHVRMPWIEQHLSGKMSAEERNDKPHVEDNDSKQSWPDIKPPTIGRKKEEHKPDPAEDELLDEEVASNFVPLSWKSPKPHTVTKSEDSDTGDGPREEGQEGMAVKQPITAQPSGFTCVQCGHVVHRSQLTKHVRMHTADRPFKCDVCKRAFRQKSNLIVHMRMHTGELPFKCDMCGKAFRQKSILVTHVRTHTREMPYKCLMCPKAFTQKSNLVEHVRVHTGEKPYICPECHKAFAQKSNLVVHIRSHTGEAPFKCGSCGKAFRQKSILTTHMRTHTGELPFKCQTCDRAFAQKSNLVEHSRQHTGEKPYICQECDKAFIRHQDLLQHMRHHTGRKPYDCTICGKMFIRKKHMEKHYKTHIKHRFNCRVCGLGFMDENLMVIHLTTHCHCHICDVNFSTKEELTEHCRLHAIGMPGSDGAERTAVAKANSESDQMHPNERVNTGDNTNKSFKNMAPDAYRVQVIPSAHQISESVGHSHTIEYARASSN